MKHKLVKKISNHADSKRSSLSLLIPPFNYSVDRVIKFLKIEYAEAITNKNRNAPLFAIIIEEAIKYLKKIKYIPETGLLLFIGNKMVNKKYLRVHYVIIPPKILTSFVYCIGRTFLLDELQDMLEHKK